MPSFDGSLPLVLTHGDIALQNVRLGYDGTVWLLDWGRSGVYPKWFEYACTMAYSDYGGRTPISWLRLALFVSGWYKTQNHFAQRLQLALDSYNITEPPPDS